jgi:hypothetical protein
MDRDRRKEGGERRVRREREREREAGWVLRFCVFKFNLCLRVVFMRRLHSRPAEYRVTYTCTAHLYFVT